MVHVGGSSFAVVLRGKSSGAVAVVGVGATRVRIKLFAAKPVRRGVRPPPVP